MLRNFIFCCTTKKRNLDLLRQFIFDINLISFQTEILAQINAGTFFMNNLDFIIYYCVMLLRMLNVFFSDKTPHMLRAIFVCTYQVHPCEISIIILKRLPTILYIFYYVHVFLDCCAPRFPIYSFIVIAIITFYFTRN